MCTVVVRVPDSSDEPVRLLAVRDEDPHRPWNPLGEWWPDRPGVEGVRDQLAGGAWLAARGPRLAVLLNRGGHPEGTPAPQLESRGGIVLAAVDGRPPEGTPRTLGFNLVEVDGSEVTVTSWDGELLHRERLAPGTHMLAHDDVDDDGTPRIAAWRDAFARTPTEGERWFDPWVRVLAESATLDPSDDRAIIRDNHAHGYPTVSLLACVAEVSSEGSEVRYAELAEPGTWNPLEF